MDLIEVTSYNSGIEYACNLIEKFYIISDIKVDLGKKRCFVLSRVLLERMAPYPSSIYKRVSKVDFIHFNLGMDLCIKECKKLAISFPEDKTGMLGTWYSRMALSLDSMKVKFNTLSEIIDHNECPKCGENELVRLYVPEISKRNPEIWKHYGKIFSENSKLPENEFILNTCKCNYFYVTPCKNKEELNEPV